MIIGAGSTQMIIQPDMVRQLLEQACDPLLLNDRRVLVIIPDSTRTAPIPLFFQLFYETIGRRAAQLDYLIALGTHPPMSDDAIDHLVGVTSTERAERHPEPAPNRPATHRTKLEAFAHRTHLPSGVVDDFDAGATLPSHRVIPNEAP